jgi:hypothetical protein
MEDTFMAGSSTFVVTTLSITLFLYSEEDTNGCADAITISEMRVP